jgi:hypothetical protein
MVALVACCLPAGPATANGTAVSSKGLGVAVLPVTVTSTSRTAVADGWTNQSSPTQVNGTQQTMSVQSRTSAARRSFVRFDLSTIPTNARVQSATLSVFMSTAPSQARTYEVDRILATWSETSLTWNTMPSVATATATTAVGTTSNVTLSWTVTTDVALMVATPSTNFGWQIKDTVETGTTTRTGTLRTREWTTAAQRPTLTIVYAV